MSTPNPPKPAHLPPIKLYNKIIKYYLPLSLSLSLSFLSYLSVTLSTTTQPNHHHTTTMPTMPPLPTKIQQEPKTQIH